MDAQLVGSRKRLPAGALAAAVVLAIAVGIAATQTAWIVSDSVTAPAGASAQEQVGTSAGVRNLATTQDRHVGSRGGPFDVTDSNDATDRAANAQGLMTPVRESGGSPRTASGTFGRRKDR